MAATDIIYLRDAAGAVTHAIVPAAMLADLGLAADPGDGEAPDDAGDIAAMRDARAEADGFYIPLAQVKAIRDGGHVVKVLREWRGMDQQALADKIGSKPGYLSQIETRARRGIRQAAELAAALDVPESFLKAHL